MKLVLTVTQSPADNNITGQTFSVDATGATLGRGPANSWVLNDGARIVSTHHASIGFQQGQFVLTDHSTNGTYVNNAVAALGQGNSTPLQSNDLIRIGKYELRVTIVSDAPAARNAIPDSFLDELSNRPPKPAAPPGPVTPSALDDFDKWLEPQSSAAGAGPSWGASNIEYGVTPDVSDEVDPLAAIDQASRGLADPLFTNTLPDDDGSWWKESHSDHAPAINQAFEPARVQRPAAPVPPTTPVVPSGFAPLEPALADGADIDALLGLSTPTQPQPSFEPAEPFASVASGWDAAPARTEPAPARPEPAPSRPAPAPVTPAVARPAIAGSGGDSARQLADLLGLGALTQEQLDALLPEAASILKESVARLLEGLRARTSIKNEMRLDRTMIQPVENNPLKFALTDKDALRYLFCADSNAYLSGSRAVKEAFDDINDHQMALLAGMRSAYEYMLARFAPATLESALGDPQSKWFLGNKKSHLWDAYEQYFVKLQQDPEESFNALFGRKFSSTYSEQIDEIKARRRRKS
ncbi:MAG: type VI secretion system-associated FHA domain protein TagH [Pseudomonadota bacterium]